jgi:hypothetical protein
MNAHQQLRGLGKIHSPHHQLPDELMRNNLDVVKAVAASRQIREQVLQTSLYGDVPHDIYSCLY